MQHTPYAMTEELPYPYEEAVARVRVALADEGFGVLTEIDVKQTLKKKLDVDFQRYVILGACSPQLAHQALQAEPDIGALLPCNVVVHERAEGSTGGDFRPCPRSGPRRQPCAGARGASRGRADGAGSRKALARLKRTGVPGGLREDRVRRTSAVLTSFPRTLRSWTHALLASRPASTPSVLTPGGGIRPIFEGVRRSRGFSL